MPYNNNILPTTMGMQTQVVHSPVVWVSGYDEAQRYQVPKNSNAVLFDSQIEGRFYIKVTDNIGMYTMRIFNFQEITNNNATTAVNNNGDSSSNYITTEQFTTGLSQMQQNILNAIQGVTTKNEQSVSTTTGTTTGSKYNVISQQ